MKVLLVSLNRYRSPMPVMPLGPCLVADGAARAGHEVRFLDLMFSRNPKGDLRRAIADDPPDAVGISLRNIDNNDFYRPLDFVPELPKAVETVRAASAAPIVLGGAAFGVMPEALLRSSGADLGVLGDGDAVFPRVLAALSTGESARTVPGTAWIEDGAYRFNGGFDSHPLDGCCAPDYGRWVDVEAYRRTMCIAAVQTKRGCEFKCVYCTYAVAEGRRYRFHPVEAVAEGVRKLVRSGIPEIEFVDSVFNAPYEHAVGLCEALAAAETGARLETLELNPAFVDGPLLKAMERAGFVGVGITAESISDRVLEGLGKQYRSGDVYRAAEAVSRSPIPCAWIFLLGGPGETKETVRETLRFAGERIRPSDVVFFNHGLRIYPGTELERRARNEGLLRLDPAGMLGPVFYLSPDVDADWLTRESDAFLAEHMNGIGSRGIRFFLLPFVYRMGYRLGVRPPLWTRTRSLRRLFSLFGVKG